MASRIDIAIDGQGFYQILAVSKRGIRWMEAVEGFNGHLAYSDQTSYTQNIADAAVCNGLRVTVNGKKYLGENRAA